MNLLKNIYEGMLDDNYPNSTQRSGINLTSKEGGVLWNLGIYH